MTAKNLPCSPAPFNVVTHALLDAIRHPGLGNLLPLLPTRGGTKSKFAVFHFDLHLIWPFKGEFWKYRKVVNFRWGEILILTYCCPSSSESPPELSPVDRGPRLFTSWKILFLEADHHGEFGWTIFWGKAQIITDHFKVFSFTNGFHGFWFHWCLVFLMILDWPTSVCTLNFYCNFGLWSNLPDAFRRKVLNNFSFT